MNSRDLLISDQQKRLCRIQLKAGVQNIGNNIASQFGKCSSSDFSPIQKALVGCLSNGIKFTVYSNGKPEVFSRIIYGFLCDTCSEITEATVKRGCFVQRLDKLQKLRKSRGFTQEELAEALFVSRTAISKWESGRGYPSIDSLKEISRYFSVSIDDLLSGEQLIFIAEKENKSNLNSVCDLLLLIKGILLYKQAKAG